MALHHLSKRKVAVKVIDKAKLTDPNEAKRIQREIRVMYHLTHECVIKLFDVSCWPAAVLVRARAARTCHPAAQQLQGANRSWPVVHSTLLQQLLQQLHQPAAAPAAAGHALHAPPSWCGTAKHDQGVRLTGGAPRCPLG